jgi:serine/threonine-protein kinase
MPVGDASPPADDPLVGRVLSERYRILRKIGEGGMGCVYQAEHALIEKKIALKVLFQDLTRRADLVARFLQEAKSASRIGHENVIDISDFGQSPEGLVYIAMEYLDGQDLGRVLKTEKNLDWTRSRPILMQIAKGLRAAHEHGIIHRDMKPENVYLVQREGRPDFVKVLDFGIAKVVTPDEGDAPRLTQTGMIFGTPEYMSPEQAQGHPPDHRVDVYAVGCIMYHMLTGSVPFHADSFMGILTKHLLEPPIPPRKRRPDLDIPADVEAVCMRAMEKDRDKRWTDMDAFYRALGAAGGQPFEPSAVFAAPKASLRYPTLAESNPRVGDGRTAIAANGPRATFEDERPIRPEGRGLGTGVKIGALAMGVAIATVAAVTLLRSSGKPETAAAPAAPAASTQAGVAPAPAPPAAPAAAADPKPVVAAPAPPAPLGKPEAPAAEVEAKAASATSSRSRRKRGEPDTAAKVDPAHRVIPVPAEDTTPAELKNPFHNP